VTRTPVRWLSHALAALAVLGLPAAAAAAPAPPATQAAAVTLPAGKANYVVAVLSDRYNASWVRLAQYAFRTDGAVHETFWYWNMATFTGNGSTNKVSSGYLTHGCQHVCLVRTPKGFEVGAAPKTTTGSYRYDSNGNLVITWPGGQSEAWSMRAQGSWARLFIITSNHGVTIDSWGFGSNAAFSQGATIDQIKAAGTLRGALRETSYGTRSVFVPGYRLEPGQFTRCTGSPCLQAPNPASWRAELAGMPTRDGRRVYFDHQQPNVGPLGPCPRSPNGHTTALLQVLDDSGAFLGFVGAEASLNARQAGGGAIISSMFMLTANA